MDTTAALHRATAWWSARTHGHRSGRRRVLVLDGRRRQLLGLESEMELENGELATELDRCCLGQLLVGLFTIALAMLLGLEFGSMGLVLCKFGYSLYSGTGLLNPNFPIKFRVPGVSTQISFRVFWVRVFWVRVRVFRVRDSGIGFSAQS